MLTISVQGAEEIRRKLEKLAKDSPEATAAAIYQELTPIIAEAARQAPVEYTRLQKSAYNKPPTVSDKGEMVGEIGFGTEYAVIQHERLDFKHPVAGKAKYLEDAVNAARDGMLDRLEARVTQNIASGTKLSPSGPEAPEE